RHRPLARGLRDHERHIVRPQQVDETLVQEALVTELHRVPQRSTGIDPEVAATVHAPMTPSGEPECRLRVARQQLEKRFEPCRVEPQRRSKLPEDWTELLLECEQA